MIWVIGRGGLLGQAVTRELERAHGVWAPSAPIIWTTSETFQSSIEVAVEEFSCQLRENGGHWTIYWCAGIGTIGATESEIDGEYDRAAAFINCLRSELGMFAEDGTVFYSSSAGGIYGASDDSPISEDSDVAINSSYGSMKLRVELLFAKWATDMKGRVAIGRISNLYGQGQNTRKRQGLVSATCLALLRQQPLEIFVSLNTVRNYVYVDDAARIIVDFAEKVMGMASAAVEYKIVCSPYNLSIAAVLYEIRRVYGRMPFIGFGHRPSSSLHKMDLSLTSVFHTEIEPEQFTPMSIGIAETRRWLLLELMSGSLVS